MWTDKNSSIFSPSENGSSSEAASNTAARGWDRFLLCLFIFLLDLASIFGNVLLMVTFYKCRELRTVSNLPIMNLAVACLLVALLVLPVWMVTTLTQSMAVGKVICNATAFMTVLLFLESISNLAVIATDRCFLICYPFKYINNMNETRMGLTIGYTWLHCLVLACLPFVDFGRYVYQPHSLAICSPDYLANLHYSLTLLVLTVGPSLLVIVVSYIQIFRVARQQARKIYSFEPHLLQKTENGKGERRDGKTKRSSSTLQLLRRQITDTNLWMNATKAIKNSMRQARAFRTVFGIIGIFFLCWIPYIIVIGYSIYHAVALSYSLEVTVTYLAFASIIANPSVGIFVNKNFRRGVRKVLGIRKKEVLIKAVAAFTSATIVAPFGRKVRMNSRSSSNLSITSCANPVGIDPIEAYN